MLNKISIKHKIFILFATILTIAVLVVGVYGFVSAKNSYIDAALKANEAKIDSLRSNIEGILGTIPADIVYNSEFYALKKMIIWKDLKEKNQVAKWKEIYISTLKDYIANKEFYYQIRFLNKKGKEVVFLKYNPKTKKVIILSSEELSNKSNRDYFKKAINLKKGEYYVSKMNLNVEHGQIEKPFMPVVRYSMPVINSNGETKGVVVINFSADTILNKIKVEDLKAKESKGNVYLINKQGYYLYHNDPNKRWGFQLDTNYNFFLTHQGYKKIFDQQDQTTFIDNDVLYAVQKIYPDKVNNKNRYWYLVSSVSKNTALSSLEQFIFIFLSILVVVLFLGFLITNDYITKLIDPLIKVTNQLNALSHGEIKKADIDYNDNDEIGQIVQSTSILVNSIETIIYQANSISKGDFTHDIQLRGANDKLGIALIAMTKRLKEITALATSLSKGNYDVHIVAKNSDDQLGLALVDMVNYLENITQVAESISLGNLDVKYTKKSKEDRLGIAILEMIKYLKTISEQAKAIANEDFTGTIISKGKDDELGNAIVDMTNILRKNSIKVKNDIWFSEGLSKFADKLTGINDIEILSQKAIIELCRYIDVASGVVYIANNEEEKLEMISSYSFLSTNEDFKGCFKISQGVVGQVAFEKKAILLNNNYDENKKIKTGTASINPKEIYVFPLIFENELFGVVEIMNINKFKSLQIDYLIKAGNILATALHSASQNTQIKLLLDESQKAFEILQIKNQEIEKAKKEIDIRADELEASNQYKSEFLANMSHELRTPLNSVILLSSLLTKNTNNNLTDADIQKAKVINQSGNELLRLINDILDLSKIESGKMELIVDQIDSKELVNHYDEIFSHTAKDKGLEFKVVDNINGIFYNDKDRLGQIIRNLISNAFKFTKQGSVTLQLDKTDNKDLPIKVSVRDTGVGIPKEKQELIFQAFMQADGSTSRQFGGTGLGLSISKELAHLMGGEIELESKENEGSTFIIYLPDLINQFDSSIGEKANISSAIKSTQTVINKKETIENKKMQFLIIEDDKVFADILKEIIENQDYLAYVAYSGKEGLEIAQKHKIDGAVIDIGLPDMSGIEVIKQLQQNPRTKNISIQVVSGKNKSEYDFNGFKIDGYLQKPVSNKQLLKAISNVKKTIRTIMIVEDDESHIEAIKSYIEEDNKYKITTATTIEDAKKLCDKEYFDLAIVDLGLGDGSGTQVCQCLKANHEDTVILIYTGRDLSRQEADFLSDISDEIIIKNPDSHERLKEEINRFLDSPAKTVENNDSIDNTKQQEQEIVDDIDYSSYDTNILKNKKVLIVDDDIKNIFVLSSALQEYNMDISHAKNGKEAIEFLEEHKDIDIILMDIMMPVMDGYEAMKAIRSDDIFKTIPIIAVSAKAMKEDKDKAIDCGANDFLPKPIDLDKLANMISKVLQG